MVDPMRTWPLQEARSHLRDVVDGAIQGGPQRITRHGKDAVIVVSEIEWNRRAGEVASFGALLAESPLTSVDRPPRKQASARRRAVFE
ncbi:type II toxin-antitoxin system Phd/YefM family antitoxin [Rhodopila sp.]|uniref:type II toxin-antitoxin system Phd/YefM family antitoxin n=1 Tax=Rhodopila sp. TaxID=2480087 RepID=UPI003D0EEFD8